MAAQRMTGPQRREQLIGVGLEVFGEKGFEAASVEEIADRAKVSKPVIYEHFGGKEGLYAVVVDREVTELTRRMAEAVNTRNPREAGERSAMAFLGYIEEREQGFRILIHDAPTSVVGGTNLASVMVDIAERIEQMLITNFKDQGFDKSTAPMYARMLIGSVTMVGEWWLESGKKPSREKVAAHVVNLMWNGIRGLERKPALRLVEEAG